MSGSMALPAAGRRWQDWARRHGVWVSVGLNLFLLAVLAAHLLQGPPRRAEPDFLSPRVVNALPQADADHVRAVMAREHTRFMASRERLDDARAALSRAILRAPYDPALVAQRLAEFRERWEEMSDRFSDTLLPVLAGLTPEGRAALVSAADRPRTRERRSH